MRANPLTAALPGTRDGLVRLAVDPFMRVAGLANVFAAGVDWKKAYRMLEELKKRYEDVFNKFPSRDAI